MPLLRRRSAAAPCPHVEAFLAAAELQTGEALKNAIAAHAATCPSCRELQQRLQAFDGPILTGQEAEWEPTEARLDSWLQNFLASEGAVDKVGRRPWWKSLTTLPVGWQLRWVLIPAAAFAVLIGSFLVGRLFAPRPGPLTANATAHRSSSANPIPAATVAEVRIPERRLAQAPQLPETAPRTRSNLAEKAAVVSNAAKPVALAVTAPAAPHQMARAFNAGTLARPALSQADEALALAPPPTPQKLTGTLATNAPDAQVLNSFAPAQPSAGAPVAFPANPAPMPAGVMGGAMPAAAGRFAAVAPAAKAEPAPAVPAPAITLDAGTRVWITLKSVQPPADGVSEFRGVLLLPVTQSGAVLFAQDTEVSGTATVSDGKRSVQILEFRSAGSHYKLRSAGGEANLRVPGAGEVVEFEAGKVLEAWMASASTYDPAEPK